MINRNAILISDLDRQQVQDFLQWVKTTRPDLVEKARNPQPIEAVSDPRTTVQKVFQKTLDLAIVHPDTLHGHYRVTPELKKSAWATAAILTTSNWIDAIGNFSCFFFVFKSLTLVPALGFACLMTGTVLVAVNAVSVGSAHGHKGRWSLAIASLILGLIPLNILQTAATGIGVEVFNNQPELAQLRSKDSLEDILKVKENKLALALANQPKVINECQQEKQSLETMPRKTDLEEKAFQSRYVRIYGTFQSQSQPITLPLDQLPLCVRSNRVEADYEKQIQGLKQEISTFNTQRADLGNDLSFLKKIAPEQYDKTFLETKSWFFLPENDQVELRSGIELVTLGTRNFFGKIQRGEWGELGLNLFLVGISAITSLASIGMAIGFSLSQDNQKSYDRSEKEKIDLWFRKMRLTLTNLHNEQLQKLDQPTQDLEKKDDFKNYN
jgi:hypothetical protein